MAERIDWKAGKPLEAVQAYVIWREAVEKGDAGDLAALVALLRSEAEFGPDARGLVADLLARHKLAKRKGGQPNKAYRNTLKEGKLRIAVKLVEYYRGKGQTAESAIASALRDNKRDDLEQAGDPKARSYSDEDVDEMVSDRETDIIENRIRRGRG